ncbi:hypothetical protein ACFC8N_26530 [Streptomyces sp. NPDC055966]|uniref:hypothetical protein n=1 Tax=Streptomyces sp. NPDC055966 TaxID=3345669 RepID=UPI0035DB7CC0
MSTDEQADVVVGARSAGGEVWLNVTVRAEVPVDRLQRMIYAGPTLHRTIEAAPGALH